MKKFYDVQQKIGPSSARYQGLGLHHTSTATGEHRDALQKLATTIRQRLRRRNPTRATLKNQNEIGRSVPAGCDLLNGVGGESGVGDHIEKRRTAPPT